MRQNLLVPVFLMLTACGTADLRPDGVSLATVDDNARLSGVALLTEVAAAHGGRNAWLKEKTLVVEMRDDWKALMFAVAGPWPENGVPFRLTYLNGRDDARIEFLETDEPDWGIQDWVTYTVAEGSDPQIEQDDDITFWLPTTTYFVEAPFRLVEATTVYELAPQTIDDREYRRVFLTWGDDAPQANVDQYIAWVDAETKRLKWLEYTIRDMGDWMAGCMHYSDFTDAGGFTLAKRMTTVNSPGGDPNLHEFVVERYEVGAKVPEGYVVVDPSRSGSKY